MADRVAGSNSPETSYESSPIKRERHASESPPPRETRLPMTSNDLSDISSDDVPLDFSVRSHADRFPGKSNHVSTNGDERRSYLEPRSSSPIGGGSAVKREEHTAPSNGRSGSNGVRRQSFSDARIGEPALALHGMLPGGMLPGMFPMFPGGLYGALPLTPDVSSRNENGERRSNKSKDQNSAHAGYPMVPQFPGMDLAAAQSMVVNPEDVFAQYKKYMTAFQDQFRQQNSPNGSSASSSSQNLDCSPQERQGDCEDSRTSMHSFTSEGAMSPSVSGSATSSAARSVYPRVPNTHTRRRGRTLPEEQKDDAYWERRRKNNEAAKRSRDSRRAKEDEIAIRAAFLEQENLKLRVEVAALKNETTKLRCMLYNS